MTNKDYNKYLLDLHYLVEHLKYLLNMYPIAKKKFLNGLTIEIIAIFKFCTLKKNTDENL